MCLCAYRVLSFTIIRRIQFLNWNSKLNFFNKQNFHSKMFMKNVIIEMKRQILEWPLISCASRGISDECCEIIVWNWKCVFGSVFVQLCLRWKRIKMLKMVKMGECETGRVSIAVEWISQFVCVYIYVCVECVCQFEFD